MGREAGRVASELSMTPVVSVIVVTYQWPKALERVLASLARQEPPPLEVIVADDGSGPETAEVVRRWQSLAPFPLHHVWQADDGFRAAGARNRAAARASGNYLLFLDGDCLAFPDFIARHSTLAEPGWFLAGSRMLMNQALSARVLDGKADPVGWGLSRWLAARFRGEVNRLLPLLRVGDANWRKRRAGKWQGARSCNLGAWKDDFLRVNGFDESYQGWGHEDADLVVRLMARDCLRKDGHYAVPVLHLWHREHSRDLEPENVKRLEDALAGRRNPVAERGVNQYLDEGEQIGG
ncbi:glycosyl transferase family 2 [bacterium endosymbiont of Escarpia laminata]|nr:MAG: glycosyl transferase family 2 [bacterium endosymbiont of Escarpia laminata]